MKNIYIVLIKAHTGLGIIARRLTKYEYTHIAISLDKSMTDFLSFSRRRHYLPFDAGFMHEKRDYYAFGVHRYFRAKIFRLNVSDVNYKKVMRFIKYCENDSELIFNLYSMATMPLLHGIKISGAYNCMSFTAKVLELSGIKLRKPYYRYSIKNIDELLKNYCIFEGKIHRIDSKGYSEYMKKCTASEAVFYGIKLVCELTKRMLNGKR